jgi:hypothetical protein
LRVAGQAPGRLLLRVALGFAAGLGLWLALSQAYEGAVAGAAEIVLRAAERPAVTRLAARGGEILVDRADFPPAAPRPGLPAADLHFNFVILASLFALSWPLRPGRTALGLLALFAVHVLALCCQVESLYATRLGPWSEANYGVIARNFWATAFHAYQIAGRFAAPFAIWWPLGGADAMGRTESAKAKGPARKRKRSRSPRS